jgi:hypothetical protein
MDWIRGALNDLPAYLETVLGQMSAAGCQLHSRDQPTHSPTNGVRDASTNRRETRVRQAQW